MTNPVDQVRAQKFRDEAAEWRVRAGSGDVSSADWSALEIWLGHSAEHRAAFVDADNMWCALDRHARAIRERFGDEAARSTKSLVQLRLRAIATIAAIAATIVVAVLAYLHWTPAGASYTTAKGETRNIVLADSSKIYLNTDSRISVRFTRNERRVAMAEGEALFDVAKDPARPFLIEVGDRQIRVVGTEFDVLHYDGRLKVSVLRGIVSVAPASGGAQPVKLEVGQQLRHRDRTAEMDVRRIDTGEAASWRDGHLVYKDATLAQVVSDLNRYFPKPIAVSEGARTLRFSGVLVLDSEDQVVRRLQSFLPVTAETSGGTILLRPRDSADR